MAISTRKKQQRVHGISRPRRTYACAALYPDREEVVAGSPGEYAKSTADLTKFPEDVLLSAYTAQRIGPIVIDASVVKEIRKAPDRATRYGILSKTLDVEKPWIAASRRHQPDPTERHLAPSKAASRDAGRFPSACPVLIESEPRL
jgi:hypothetical protein